MKVTLKELRKQRRFIDLKVGDGFITQAGTNCVKLVPTMRGMDSVNTLNLDTFRQFNMVSDSLVSEVEFEVFEVGVKT